MINPYKKYKENAITEMSQEQLVIKLVDGAVKYTRIAKIALINGDNERASNELIRVQQIFGELDMSLDKSAGDFTQELSIIYRAVKEKLRQANIKKDVSMIDEVLPLIEQIRDIWYEVKRLYDQKQ